jgi:glyoxylase-like metal-dependent hydrolase (beta-lactamase superfamily II)
VIDPCRDLSAAGDSIVDYLLITHEHYDHISGVNEWKKKTGAPLLCSRVCAENIRNSKKNMSRYFNIFCEMQTWVPIDGMKIEQAEYVCEADLTFEDEFTFEWQGHIVTLQETPGHSAGSCIIYLDEDHCFTGDSYLENYGTECRFPGGSEKRWNMIGKPRIEAIPAGTRIWPGHFDSFIK